MQLAPATTGRPPHSGSSSRYLATSDPIVSRFVRVHRDDASTDESTDEDPIHNGGVNNDGSRTPSVASFATSGAHTNHTEIVSAHQTGSCQWHCFGPRRSTGSRGSKQSPQTACRSSCGVTPMACFSGVVGGGVGGGSVSSSGCGPRAPWKRGANSWVCAVLPVDSASDSEDAADDEFEGGSNSAASTATPGHSVRSPALASVVSSSDRSDMSARSLQVAHTISPCLSEISKGSSNIVTHTGEDTSAD
eukprot:TRINITY_DN62528_c0_g1_i1.p1 TRINITY_DN62528_c0_g1~~TRINITY_DN62528_c0_g1_i1.p1  ORF type:complete len:248 (+),score=26.28 TRINITY_DN62528_c0_g1_i1:112-855(+)